MIPLLDLKAVNEPMQADIESAMARVARSGRYILGPEVEAFEAEWAAYCGVKHCVGTGNALDALRMILTALGIGPGDEVIVPANTYIATWLSVTHAGATPVPVDADYQTMNIDPAQIEAAITPRTAAIIAVHLYGLPAGMDAIRAIAERHHLVVLEDAAQAHGARIRDRLAGSFGHAAAFSFYPTKNLGALGDGGCVTTDSAELAGKVRRLRHYGGTGRVDHQVKGINSRLDELQAAILRAKLPYLNMMNLARRRRAFQYMLALEHSAVFLPPCTFDSAWHQFVVRSTQRNRFQQRLSDEGLDAHVHYPVPPHLEPAYADLNLPEGSFPVAERLAREVLSLPIGYDFNVAAVIRAVKRGAGVTPEMIRVAHA